MVTVPIYHFIYFLVVIFARAQMPFGRWNVAYISLRTSVYVFLRDVRESVSLAPVAKLMIDCRAPYNATSVIFVPHCLGD